MADLVFLSALFLFASYCFSKILDVKSERAYYILHDFFIVIATIRVSNHLETFSIMESIEGFLSFMF
jgi:hypothetical protein